MVSADIFRGRYRESLETAKAIASDKPLPYHFLLPTANHVFLPGHRIMVQVQSSWFPLYDRNPQTFVPNIFWAKPGDYRKATHFRCQVSSWQFFTRPLLLSRDGLVYCANMNTTPWKNKIVAHANVDPRDLIAHDKNWRQHPKAQSDVFVGRSSERSALSDR